MKKKKEGIGLPPLVLFRLHCFGQQKGILTNIY